jgi:hypothetical protein
MPDFKQPIKVNGTTVIDATGMIAAARLATKIATVISFQASGATTTWTSMPSALTEFRGTSNTRTKVDLTNATEARITVRTAGTAGATGAVLAVQYSTDQSTWKFLDDGASPVANTNAVAIDSTNTTFVQSSWTTLAAGAKGDVFLRLVGQNGDGTVSPAIGMITLQVR